MALGIKIRVANRQWALGLVYMSYGMREICL